MEKSRLGSLTPRGTRRVIYNSDPSNTIRHLSEPEATEKELRQVVCNYVEKGAIDTLVQEIWHQGWTHFWRSDNCAFDARPHHQRLVPMMDAGVVPVEIYIDECHQHKMEFIAGFRINDRHGHDADLFEKLSQTHPDWILKEYKPSSPRTADPRSYAFGCALDYSIDEVRDWIFSIMEEAANRFDIDGIELNYHRLPACFPKGKAEASHAIMTDFVRRIRTMLDDAGKRKGRKLLLGARVLLSVAGCKKMGLDVPLWIAEELIDYVAPGDIGFTDPNAQFEEFVHLARTHNCYVYPQIQAKLGYHHRDLPQTPAHCRAAVQNFYGAGADGFSTQNYFEVEEYPALKTLRNPDLITKQDRHYVFYPLWGPRGGSQVGYAWDFPYEPEQIDLNRQHPGEHGTFRFRICEYLSEDTEATLTFKSNILPEDEIAVDINGETIPSESITCKWYAGDDPLAVCRFALHAPPAKYGDNHLGLKLIKSTPEASKTIVMNEMEVMIKA